MLEKVNVYLELDKRESWDESQCSIIGYYDVVVPIKSRAIGVINNDYEIIKQVKMALGTDINEIKVDKKNVTFNCYKGQGDYAYNLQEVYRWKDEIEDKVRENMRIVSIKEYDLIIHVTSLTYIL